MTRSVIIGCGSYLPEKILTNHDLEKMVDTNDAWIMERTGIKKRHIAAEGENTSDLAAHAAKNALAHAGIEAEDIDLIIVATTTPDNTFPATATKVQDMLGTKGAAFDMQAVCAGFIYALSTADSFIRAGNAKRVLVIGADTLSRLVDWTDRGTCILFGDGAGAVILEAQEDTDSGILTTNIHSGGNTRDILYVDGGPGSTDTCGKIKMAGKDVFKHATMKLSACTKEAIEACGLTLNDITWAVPHQANIRIIEAMSKRLKIPSERVITTVSEHANTSAASIPLALDSAVQAGKIKKGDVLALQAIGGGLSWGAAIIKW
jgi:3-oxoacyl-[acyl-carrier-protein] synthase-3